MEEEFNLSEKMTSGDRYRFWYHEKDIKEFIKRFLSYCEDTNIFIDPLHIAKFKKLAGEELKWNKKKATN